MLTSPIPPLLMMRLPQLLMHRGCVTAIGCEIAFCYYLETLITSRGLWACEVATNSKSHPIAIEMVVHLFISRFKS